MEVVSRNKVVSLKNEDNNLYEILSKLPGPEASMKLTRAQKKWWVWFGVELLKTKDLAKLDLIHLQQAAFWMDARCQAYGAIRDLGYRGLVQTFKNGTTNITGHVTIIEKADKHLQDISSHFGLSMRDRNKLKVKEPADDSQLNLFDEIKKSLNQK